MDHDDHQDGHEAVNGPWAGGWLVAAIAGMAAATLARLLGDIGMAPAFAVGMMVFAVFGVLLGSGGVELTVVDHDDDHSGGHH